MLIRACLEENVYASAQVVGRVDHASFADEAPMRYRHWVLEANDIETMMLLAMEDLGVRVEDAYIEDNYGYGYIVCTPEHRPWIRTDGVFIFRKEITVTYRFWAYSDENADTYPGEIRNEELPWVPV